MRACISHLYVTLVGAVLTRGHIKITGTARPRAPPARDECRTGNRECAVPRPELPTGHVSLMPLYLSISPPIMSNAV